MVQSSTQRKIRTGRNATQLVPICAVSTKGLVTLPRGAPARCAPSAVDGTGRSARAARVPLHISGGEGVYGAKSAAWVMLVSQPAIVTFSQPASKTQVQPPAPS